MYYASQINLFSERVVNVWNNLPAGVDFKSLSSFKRTVKLVDFSKFLKCFKTFLCSPVAQNFSSAYCNCPVTLTVWTTGQVLVLCTAFLCVSDRLMLLLYTVTLSLRLLLKLNDDDDDDDDLRVHACCGR